jgi:hypothetical protein
MRVRAARTATASAADRSAPQAEVGEKRGQIRPTVGTSASFGRRIATACRGNSYDATGRDL